MPNHSNSRSNRSTRAGSHGRGISAGQVILMLPDGAKVSGPPASIAAFYIDITGTKPANSGQRGRGSSTNSRRGRLSSKMTIIFTTDLGSEVVIGSTWARGEQVTEALGLTDQGSQVSGRVIMTPANTEELLTIPLGHSTASPEELKARLDALNSEIGSKTSGRTSDGIATGSNSSGRRRREGEGAKVPANIAST